MRKPSLELKLQKRIDNMIVRERIKKRKQLAVYCIDVLDSKTVDKIDLSDLKIKVGYEPVKNYSIEIYTVRIGDILLFREFPAGATLTDRRYEIYV